MMGLRLPSVISNARKVHKLQSLLTRDGGGVPKGHIVVYVGESERKPFVVPLSFLSHPSFQNLLKYAEEEFGFYHPMGGLTIPCKEEEFINLTCRLNSV